MFWIVAASTAAISLLSFTGAAVAMRQSKEPSEVIQLGMAALALLLGGAVLPWQLLGQLKGTPDVDLRLCGILLAIGCGLFIVSYLAFLAYYFPHSEAIAAKTPYEMNYLELICKVISYLFYVAAVMWCVGFGWIAEMLIVELMLMI